MNASLARRKRQLPEVDLFDAADPSGQYSQYAEDLSERGNQGSFEGTSTYTSSLAAYPGYLTTTPATAEESFQPHYSSYGIPFAQYQHSTNVAQPMVAITLLDPRLIDGDGAKEASQSGPTVLTGHEKYIGYSSGLSLLADLLRVMALPQSVPWPQLACDSFLAEMHTSQAIAALPIPCRKTSSVLLDTYDETVSPLYPVYTRAELQDILDKIYLNGIIARRDIAECTGNCFALVIGQVISILGRHLPVLDKMAQDCANFTRSGLAEVFLKPSICGLRYLLCILLTNHSRELADPIWYTSGMAMQMCVDLNLHSEVMMSKTGDAHYSEQELEENRRVFWTVYSIDRGLALAFGRPPSLAESVISCPFPKTVSAAALNRFKIRRIQARIMQTHLHLNNDDERRSKADVPFPDKLEQQLMHEVIQWSSGKVGEEAIQGGNTELLLLRRGITNRQAKPTRRAAEIIAQNMQLYRTEALLIARVEGLLLVHDIFVNLVSALYIFRFGEHSAGITLQMLYSWIEHMRPIFAHLSQYWSTVRQSFNLVENLFFRLQEWQGIAGMQNGQL